MDSPINLDNLDAIIGYNPELRTELFQLFISATHDSLSALKKSWQDHDDVLWAKETHALKGLCLNLGAETLAALCAHAQNQTRAPRDTKEQILISLEQQVANVQEALALIMQQP